ncbi:MFS transporter [Oceanicoccus sp. KOV_DT_Chl]|uniref:spinster family MFS transporter n=1 Tax=Oceanicoccus sp. KOV_DT_Chl TaxID=1904639 RepID=UPI000C7E7123|nr:MFS transporter [Oceanicoccus sp. KOV_DT_Chl]
MSEADNTVDSKHANYVLTILLVAYILSFIDRNILALLVGPIREDFAISDFQFSLLHGLAFTLFYIFLGLPIGWLADRYSRKWIITGGVLFWSLMTCWCGLAKNFGSLFITRIGVGVGEATLSPAAYSLMGDYFSAKRLSWATAIFAMGITLGSGGSYIIGGWLYDQLVLMDLSQWPLLSAMKPWQITFVGVGLPGFLVVILMLFVKEPPRRSGSEGEGEQLSVEEAIPLQQVLAYWRTHWQAYSSVMLGVSAMSIIGYGTLIWYPEFLFRTYQLSKTEAGGILGTIFIVAGTAGTLSGAWFSTLLQNRGYQDANVRLVMLVALLLIIPAVAAPLMPSGEIALWLTVPVIFFHYTHFGVAMAGLQLITPNRMRAQTSALMLFMTNLFGLALGGSFVAFFTDFIFQDDLALRYSLAVVAIIFYPLAAILIGLGLKHYRAALLVVR